MDIHGSPFELSRAVRQELSPRELEILGLMARGYSNPAIREELWLSARTVEAHVRNIFIKLGVGALAGRDRRVTAVLAFLDAAEEREVVAA